MTMMEVGLIIALLLCGGLMAFCFSRSSSNRAECEMVRDALDEVQSEASALRDTAEERLRLQTEAETRMVTIQEALDIARQQRDAIDGADQNRIRRSAGLLDVRSTVRQQDHGSLFSIEAADIGQHNPATPN